MRSPKRRLKTSQRKQAVAFVAIALFVTCAVSLPILLVALSSRPDLYSVKPKPTKPGVAALDWESLGDLLSSSANPPVARSEWFGPEVEIAGYMLPASPSRTQQKVTHFLLVPDPGDWLNPPHMHPGEVIDVLLKDGATTRLMERTAITVAGRLSYGSMNSSPRAVLFLADATVQQPLARSGF
jgi:hypothetical protein